MVGLLWTSDQSGTEAATYPVHYQHKHIHVLMEIQTRGLSNKTASDLRIRLHGHYDRQFVP
jgi:hypothetical protein